MPILPRFALLAGLCALVGWGARAGESVESSHMLTGRVMRVIDGDTLEMQVGKRRLRVHVNGVDAPELAQPWGKEASNALAQLVMGQNVDLEPVGSPRGSRITAIVFIGEAELGAALVDAGNAWADRQDLRPSDIGLCEVEASARAGKRGLWALPAAQRVPPWEFRRRFLHPTRSSYAVGTAEDCKAVAMHRRVDKRPAATGTQAPARG